MEIVIKPKNKWWELDTKELWHFRDLFYFLTWRDVKVRYKQTVIGALWALFQPFITMIVFTIFFGHFINVPSEGVPYALFVYVGLIFWSLFSSGLSSASNSFIENEKIVTKIYFPRVMLPVSSIITAIIDTLVALTLLGGMMVWYRFLPSLWIVVAVPFLLIVTVLSTLGIGLLFASLNVKYRDMRFVLPFFIQLLLFITPVIYPVSVISENFHWILGLNPMAGVIEAARSLILNTRPLDITLCLVSLVSAVIYAVIGFMYFKKTERYFADVI